MLNFMTKLKAKVFIEGSNIYFEQKKMGKWLDWVKVKRYLVKEYELLNIHYYIGVRYKDSKVLPFLKKLKTINFDVITKPVKLIIDESGRKIEKANFDVEITGDVLSSYKNLDVIILFSGDSDFDYLVKILHKQNKKVYVFSSRKTLSWELKLSADKHFFLEDLLNLTKEDRNFMIENNLKGL